ncbi:4'-phosphopantetheinyl transferase family protein [Paenibacillus xylanexedens]|uniref:4'-phosphopantetheinyl transferase family protein n=1 Tax=Paenibacillus xylanexedens TaxID=528191 RepID=UPI0011A724D6|nr:4'-phosphopantetheinyl transferase superfamily protein [Paenibacillus xylanexedens]
MIRIQVLQVPAELPEAYWSLFQSHVSEERRAQAARFVHQVDAYRSVLGEVLTRVTLSKRTGLRPEELSLTRNQYGKPSFSLSHDADVPFNVSHSGDWIALISGGDAALGVDIEKIDPIDMKIAEQFFSLTESIFLAAEPAEMQLDTFYRLWTLKESYIKAVGMGLSIPLDSFSIIRRADGNWHSPQAATSLFLSLRLDQGHMLAACSAGEDLPTQPDFITTDELYQALLELSQKS